MNPVQYVADADSSLTPLWLRSATVLLVLFGCVSLRSAAQQQQAARSVVIDLSVLRAPLLIRFLTTCVQTNLITRASS